MEDRRIPVAAALFSPPEPGKPPVFESQSDLARAIADEVRKIYAGRAASVRALLQQVLAGKRKFPKELAEEVLDAARLRRGPETWIARLQEEIDHHNNIIVPAVRGGQPAVEPLDEMAAIQARASQVLIFTSLPLELQADLSDSASRLRELPLETFLDDKRTTEYTYCVPRLDLAVGLWRTWYTRLAETSGSRKASATLASWESKLEPEVLVYVVPEVYCLHPLVVFNMKEKDRALHAAFIWYSKHDEKAILRLPDLFLETEWKEAVYTRLRRSEIPGQKRITWAKASQKIRQEVA